MRSLLMLALTVSLALSPAFAAGENVSKSEPASQPIILVAIPIDASAEAGKNSWFAGISEQLLHFRFSASDEIITLSPQKTHEKVTAPATMNAEDYRTLARAMGASHVVQQNYEVLHDGKSVQCLFEIVPVAASGTIRSFERTMALESLAKEIDEAVKWVFSSLDVTPDKNLKRFFSIPAIPIPHKDLRPLGNAANATAPGNRQQRLVAAQKCVDIADKDSRNLLAQYVAAMAFARSGRHDKAIDVLIDILAVIPNHKALYIDMCRSLRHEGRFSEVLRYARSAENKKIRSAELLLEGALAFEALGKQDKARRVFEAIRDENPAQPDALLFFARENNRRGQYAEAIALAQKLLAADSRTSDAHLEIGNALALMGRKSAAIKALEKCVAIAPETAAAHRLLGDLYTEAENHAKAAFHYDFTAKINPRFFAGHLTAAEAWDQAGRKKEALAVLTRTERLFPDSVVLQKRIGMLQKDLGNTANAVLRLERYVKDGEPELDVYLALGDILAGSEKYDRALFMYNHALPLMKDKKSCRRSLAAVHMKKNDPKSAISELLEILKEDPAYPKVHRMLADAWYTVGTTTEALACYKKARELEGAGVAVQQRIADITFEKKDWRAAGPEYRRLVKLDANNAMAHYRLGIISLDQGKMSFAESSLAAADKLGPADVHTSFLIARGFDKAGKHARAAEFYRASLAQDPKREDALLGLAEAYLRLKQKIEAAQCYERVYAIDNDKNRQCCARAALLYEEENRIAKAHELFKAFVAKGYKNPTINLHLARLEHGHHNYENVINLLASLDKSMLSADKTAAMLGESYYHTKRFADARAWLEIAATRMPEDISLTRMLAVSYEKEGMLSKARITYANLAELVSEPERMNCVYHIGQLYESDRKTDKAIIRYRDNIGEHPDDMRNYDRLVALLMQQKDLAGARAILEKAVARPGDKSDFVKMLAQTCELLGDSKAAVIYYKRYLEVQPQDCASWQAVGSIYFANSKFANASDALARAAAINPDDFATQRLLAQSLRRAGMIEQAIAAAAAAHELNPAESNVVVLLADCYRTSGQTDKLIVALKSLTELRPGDFDTWHELGTLLCAAERTEEGVAVLEQASTMRPRNVELHLLLARYHEMLGDGETQYAHIKDALGASKNNVDANYEMGRYQARTDNEKKAIRYFEHALELDNEHVPTLFAYSRLLHTQGDTERAYEYMQHAVELDRFTPQYQVLFSRLCWELKKVDAATEAVEAALNSDPSSVDALSLAGRIYTETGKADKAKEVLTKAISKDETCADCHRYMGELCFEQCDYARAIGYFKRAIDIAGYNERTAVRLARAYKLGCRDTKARALFEKVLERNEQQYEAFYQLTNLYVRSGRIEEAKEMVQKRRREQKTVWHHLAAGEIHEIQGDSDAAKISYTVALRLMPQIPEAHSGLGRIALMRKDYANAIVNFGKALARDPYNPYLMLDMARGYEGIGEIESAYEIYREVSGKYPQVAEAYYRFALLKSRHKQHMRALEIVEKGLRHNPKNPRLLIGLGHSYRILNRYNESIQAFEEAASRGGKQYIGAYLHIASIYAKQFGNEQMAQKYFKKYQRAGGELESAKRQMAIRDFEQ